MSGASLAQSGGQDPDTHLPDTDFVVVDIDGAVNMRAGPTTDADRLQRLADGTLLRRVTCEAGRDESWCEVELADGSLEGWVAARFLVAWYGADPFALESTAIPSDRRIENRGEGTYAGTLEKGEVLDLMLSPPADTVVGVTLKAAAAIGTSVFSQDAAPLASGRGTSELAVLLPEGGKLLIRIADMDGDGGNWKLDVAYD
ncbi:SH3 domain-containing protein [Meridianimarinicoccus zhengii]|uniref:SH3 domain-containing protein n=1 Tax=Meridianimarinicoccus zhengii TaxID=2056810 RepID=UPI0013A6BFFA|nr:SH3 domain-containing protein [Phycocomes zhengii]